MFEIEGLDISKYQSSADGTQTFDFTKSIGKVQFFIFRSSVGSGEDYKVREYCQLAHDNDFPYGLYHFAKPNHSWETQANLFIHLIDQLDPQLDVWLDIEDSGGLGKTALYSWVSKFLTKVKDNVPNNLGIYTSAGFWNNYLPRTDLGKYYDLWAASWFSSTPTLPYDWGAINNPRTAKYWQYAVYKDAYEYGSKGDDDIDHNTVFMTIDEFNSHYGTNIKKLEEIPLPPPPELTKIEAGISKCIVSALNIRKGPGTNYSIVDQLVRNDIVERIEERIISNNTWMRIGHNQWCAKVYNGVQYLLDI